MLRSDSLLRSHPPNTHAHRACSKHQQQQSSISFGFVCRRLARCSLLTWRPTALALLSSPLSTKVPVAHHSCSSKPVLPLAPPVSTWLTSDPSISPILSSTSSTLLGVHHIRASRRSLTLLLPPLHLFGFHPPASWFRTRLFH